VAPPSSWSWKRLVELDQGEHQHKAEFLDRLVQQEVQARPGVSISNVYQPPR
jgi:hypothetical protein